MLAKLLHRAEALSRKRSKGRVRFTLGKEKGYYIVDRSFSIPEIKILIDAVQAASFITDRKTEELIDKLAALGGSHKAEILKNNIVHFNTRKHSNESIFYNVDTLELALQSRKKVIFKYFDLDADRKAVYRRDGHHYVVEPVALVFNEDNYYLVCYSSRYQDTANYRVDRMADVTMIDENISEKAIELKETVGEYTGQALKMFSGQLENVVLEFDKKLIGAVYDRFGEETAIIKSGEDKCVATVAIQISPTFWGWMFQFGKDMRILSPATLINEYCKCAEALLNYSLVSDGHS